MWKMKNEHRGCFPIFVQRVNIFVNMLYINILRNIFMESFGRSILEETKTNIKVDIHLFIFNYEQQRNKETTLFIISLSILFSSCFVYLEKKLFIS